MRSPGSLWWALKRDWKRGSDATWGDYVLRPRIWRWRNPHAGLPLQPVAVHVLCGDDQFDLCAWMLASWTHQTGRNWRIVIHDDGSLDAGAQQRLASLGLALEVVPRHEADQRMLSALAPFPKANAYRIRHPLAIKIFDIPHMAAERFILLDTDVLFFARPDRILAWVDSQADTTCWFNEDVAEASNVSTREAHDTFGINLWPKVNSGLCLITRAALDLGFCEQALSTESIHHGHIWRMEQTLFALCASRYGHGGLLPESYEVSLARSARPGAIARHYVGAVRDRFWGEGVRRLAPVLMP